MSVTWTVLAVGAAAKSMTVAFAGFIRLSPTRAGRWHLPPPAEGAKGVVVSITRSAGPQQALVAVDRVARRTPRTRAIAGTPEEGMITYETRSLLFGFPDYTTVQALAYTDGTRLIVHARQRFGRSDFGVNKARVDAWLAALDGAP